MKFTFIKNKEKEEVIIYAKEKTPFITQIENLCIYDEYELLGNQNGRYKELKPQDIECFISENDKVFALINKEKYQIKKDCTS